MLEYINRARSNPAAEGQLMSDSANTNQEIANAQRYFGFSMSEVVNDFNSYQAVPPLAFNPSLIDAARGHTQSMITANQQAHQISGEPGLRERTIAAGYTEQSAIRENIYAYMSTIFVGHAAFQIDWGNTPSGIQTPPGHRENILDVGSETDPFTEIGIGIADSPLTGSGNVGPKLVTQNFGRPSPKTNYIVGVVYTDTDNDGFYSIGEGISGITISPDQGDFYAVTSNSGGYAIPLKNVSGTINVTASGTALGADQAQTFTYNNQSVKIDFIVNISDGSGNDSGDSGDSGDSSGSGDSGDSDNSSGGSRTHNPLVDFGEGSQGFGNNIYIQTTWFGAFFDLATGSNPAPDGFIYHEEHAAIYYLGDETGMWLWSQSLEWCWTAKDIYPYMYINNRSRWYFYVISNTQPRYFFDTSESNHFFNDPTNSSILTEF